MVPVKPGSFRLRSVQQGQGRVYLLAFRPQWRGQSHGTYKFFMNAMYESQGLSKPGPAKPPEAKPLAPAAPEKKD